MPTLDITADTVHVRFTRAERVAGLLRDQHLPLAAVTGTEVVQRRSCPAAEPIGC